MHKTGPNHANDPDDEPGAMPVEPDQRPVPAPGHWLRPSRGAPSLPALLRPLPCP